jgi:prevent-host-death family protein
MTTRVVNTHEAKSRLSELIREAEQGHDVIIARNGQAVAKLVPWPPVRPARTAGAWAGQVQRTGDDIGADDDIAALFDRSVDQPLDQQQP